MPSGIYITGETTEQEKERYRRYWAKSRKKNREKISQRHKNYYKTLKGRTTHIYNNIRNKCIKEKLYFDLKLQDIKELLEIGHCNVSKIIFNFDDPKSPFRPSIDRLNNNEGYYKENIQAVCIIYNYAKNIFNHEDVIILAKALINNND